MEIVHGTIGSEAEYQVKFEGLQMVAEAKYEGAMGGVKASVFIPADKVVAALFDMVEKAIPGDQKAMFDLAKGLVVGAMPK
jgi:hypothetical protein